MYYVEGGGSSPDPRKFVLYVHRRDRPAPRSALAVAYGFGTQNIE
jgi:hypothetical protein